MDIIIYTTVAAAISWIVLLGGYNLILAITQCYSDHLQLARIQRARDAYAAIQHAKAMHHAKSTRWDSYSDHRGAN